MSHTTRSRPHSADPVCRPGASRRAQRGLTLVELMIAVLVASLLIAFVFDIQGRMSNAFRSQTNIGSLQQGVRAANELIARDARLTGFMAPNGIRVSSKFLTSPPTGLVPDLVQLDGPGNAFVPALVIANNPAGMAPDRMQPDRVHFFYADPNPLVHTVVVEFNDTTSVVVSDASSFKDRDLLLFARRDPTLQPHPLGNDMPVMTNYFTCLVRATTVDTTTNVITFADTSEPFNTPGNEHCFANSATREAAIAVGTGEKTQVFRLVARAYQIDTSSSARLQIGPLERSETGGLLGEADWQEIGIGFVDLQISQRYVEEVPDPDDLDADGDTRADWYTSTPPPLPAMHFTQLGIGMVARTARSVEGVRTDAVPVLTRDNCAPGCTAANNPYGDAGEPKNMLMPEYNPEGGPFRSSHVYRQSTSIVDIRNLGNSY